jgi:hypothetical protein
MTDRTWLHDIILVNDGPKTLEPGDVSVFRSAGDACSYLEPWWVEERHGMAFNAFGEKVSLGTDDSRVVVKGYQRHPDGEEIVLCWLNYSARAILEARLHKAAKGKLRLGEAETKGVLPTSVEGLVAYVGFTA